jgi:hypothetical protein
MAITRRLQVGDTAGIELTASINPSMQIAT